MINKNTLPETDANNVGQFAGWMSINQVLTLLVATQVYSNANGNQGLIDVAGANYGERAQTILNSFLQSKSIQGAVQNFKIPLDEYIQ